MTFRIMIVHSVYQNLELSGENNVVDMQTDFLKSLAEVEVRLVNQKYVPSGMTFVSKIQAAIRVASGYGESPLKNIKDFKPDLVVVHNLFPNFGTRWLRKVAIPTLLYHHNFRNYCASGNFFRQARPCQLCITKSPLQAIKYSCYRKSKIATLPLVIKQLREKSHGPKVSKLVKYVSVSNSISLILEKSGIPKEDIATIPNFVENQKDAMVRFRLPESTSKWVAVGRLVEEKGFGKLVENWPDNFYLEIIGDGPFRSKLEELIRNQPNIKILGSLPRSEVVKKLPTYLGAIIPSIWSEGSPLTEMEFRRAGLPIIQVNRPGYYGEQDEKLIIPYDLFIGNKAKPHFDSAINYVVVNRRELSIHSRFKFDSEYTPCAWVKSLNSNLENWFGISIN